MVLCGAVSAEDTSTGGDLINATTAESNNSSSDVDPRIYGVIKENDTPANGAILNIRNPSNNTIIASGTTNSSGDYDISFISNFTEFNVEIAYSTYLNYTAKVTPTGSPVPTAVLNHTFVPSKNFELKIYDSSAVSLNPDYFKRFGEDLKDADIYIIHLPL